MIDTFEYNIKTKNDYAVVTLNGPMTKDAREQLEQCHQDLMLFEAKNIILYFKEVLTLDAGIYRELTLLQQDIRKKNKSLNLVGLCASKKQILVDKGVVRVTEVKTSLEEALKLKVS